MLQRKVDQLKGNELSIKPQIKVRKQTLGTEYGGWTIAPERIAEDSVIYSFGIGLDISFDLKLIEQYGAVVHGFDPTPKSIC